MYAAFGTFSTGVWCVRVCLCVCVCLIVVVMSGLGEGESGGLPLQLTTITVAVPASLDNSLLNGIGHHGGVVGGTSAAGGPATSLLSPIDQQHDGDCTTSGAFKWKYQQQSADKLGTPLVRKSAKST